MAAVIGALRAELSASIAKFKEDMGKAAESVRKFASDADKQGKKLQRMGAQLSLFVTAPIVLFGRQSVIAAKESRAAFAQVEAALASVGNQSGRTVEQLQQAAKALERLSLFDDDDILAKVTANLLAFGNVTGEVFDRTQKLIVDFATRTGTDLQAATRLWGKALNDPVRAITVLRRAGVALGQDQEKLIKSLVASGRGMEAQNIILAEAEKRFAGAGEAARKASPDAAMQQAWRDFQETIGEIVLEFLVPLTQMLTKVLEGFQALPPWMQKTIVAALAIAAAVGPVLTIFGSLIRVVAFLTPAITALAVALAGLSAVVWGWIAAIVAAVAALVIFWKALQKAVVGDFTGAVQEAKKSAVDLWNSLTSIFKGRPVEVPVKVTTTGGDELPKFNFGEGGEAPDFDAGPQAEKAAESFAAAIVAMDQKIARGMGRLELPQSVAFAEDLNRQIEAFVAKAKEAGVDTNAWATQLAGLRDRIGELEEAGLAKEAEKFSLDVDRAQLAVRRFQNGALDPLEERLDDIDTGFQRLRVELQAQIDENTVLAEKNDEAAAAMERLRRALANLTTAHAAARDAAEAQWRAEVQLADLNAARSNAQTRTQIEDLMQRKGIGAPTSRLQEDLQNAQRELSGAQLDSLIQLKDLEAQKSEAERVGDEDAIARLNSQIALQTQLYDLIRDTSAEELVAAERTNEAWRNFSDGLEASLTDMIMNWKFDLNSLQNVFKQLAADLFVKPAVEGFTAFATSALKSAFAGGFDVGGSLGPGQWGIAGEDGPEPVVGGRHGMTIFPNESLDGRRGDVTQNFYFPPGPAYSFNQTRTQTAGMFRRAAIQAGRNG